MKIAIISDIHGNLEALKTVLEDIKIRNIEKIFCLGDIIHKGVHSNECVDLVRQNCEVIVQGNCDEVLSIDYTDEELNKENEVERKRRKWMMETLTKENKKFLRKLPYSYEFYISGSLIRAFHATPEYNNVAIINLDSIQEKYEMFKGSNKTDTNKVADIILYGHIHHQYMDKLYNKTLINVGSVGNSFDAIRNEEKDSSLLDTTCAHYVIIEGEYGEKNKSAISFDFVRLPYDIEKELEDEYLNIEKENYKYEIREGLYRDMNKIYKGFTEKGIDITKI